MNFGIFFVIKSSWGLPNIWGLVPRPTLEPPLIIDVRCQPCTNYGDRFVSVRVQPTLRNVNKSK